MREKLASENFRQAGSSFHQAPLIAFQAGSSGGKLPWSALRRVIPPVPKEVPTRPKELKLQPQPLPRAERKFGRIQGYVHRKSNRSQRG
jgi:hypothetical protein